MNLNQKISLEKAQGLVEYGLIISLVGLIVVIALSAFGGKANDTYDGIIDSLQGKTTPQIVETPTEKQPSFDQTACENESSNLKNWKIASGQQKDWESKDGSLCVENHKSDDNFAFSECSMDKNLASDYEVELSGARLEDGDAINLMFRMQKYTQKPDGYAFTYDKAANAFVLIKWVKGDQTPIASAPATGFSAVTSHNLKVQVQGATINAYVDGQLVLSTTDNTYTSGGTGVRVSGAEASACFNDLVIRTSGD